MTEPDAPSRDGNEPQDEDVLELPPLTTGLAPVHEGPERPVERTRALLAYLLLLLLSAEILTLLALLGFERISVDDFSALSAVTVTPIVGLLGAATGYYYGRVGR